MKYRGITLRFAVYNVVAEHICGRELTCCIPISTYRMLLSLELAAFASQIFDICSSHKDERRPVYASYCRYLMGRLKR